MKTAVGFLLLVLFSLPATRSEAHGSTSSVFGADDASGNENVDLEHALSTYEAIRIRLATGHTEGTSTLARKLGSSARAAIPKAREKARGHLEKMAESSARMETATEIADLRAHFGELSRAVVALLASDPELAHHWYVFECTMVRGYHKWAQRVEDAGNPYLGDGMIPCAIRSTAD